MFGHVKILGSHDVLLDKLSYLYISGISTDLLQSYLSNKQQYVIYKLLTIKTPKWHKLRQEFPRDQL